MRKIKKNVTSTTPGMPFSKAQSKKSQEKQNQKNPPVKQEELALLPLSEEWTESHSSSRTRQPTGRPVQSESTQRDLQTRPTKNTLVQGFYRWPHWEFRKSKILQGFLERKPLRNPSLAIIASTSAFLGWVSCKIFNAKTFPKPQESLTECLE